jgi:hypothetical protein
LIYYNDVMQDTEPVGNDDFPPDGNLEIYDRKMAWSNILGAIPCCCSFYLISNDLESARFRPRFTVYPYAPASYRVGFGRQKDAADFNPKPLEKGR